MFRKLTTMLIAASVALLGITSFAHAKSDGYFKKTYKHSIIMAAKPTIGYKLADFKIRKKVDVFCDNNLLTFRSQKFGVRGKEYHRRLKVKVHSCDDLKRDSAAMRKVGDAAVSWGKYASAKTNKQFKARVKVCKLKADPKKIIMFYGTGNVMSGVIYNAASPNSKPKVKHCKKRKRTVYTEVWTNVDRYPYDKVLRFLNDKNLKKHINEKRLPDWRIVFKNH